jgi:succinate dehydrogenase / fumarate reductase iron-sulfur subunit
MATMNLTLHVWRQKDSKAKGQFETYKASNVSEHMSFLEMLDVVNERLESQGAEPIVFEHDCREGICGSCGFIIDGEPHGHRPRTTVCQLHMREFSDGDELTLEPFRSRAFPVLKDLMVDRNAFDRVIQSGGYVSIRTGAAADANATPINKASADTAFDAVACIGCGACVAACPNASAMLFTGAKITHLGLLPQGQSERYERVEAMTSQMDSEGFGACTNVGECSRVCPKGITLDVIAQMNRDLIVAQVVNRKN